MSIRHDERAVAGVREGAVARAEVDCAIVGAGPAGLAASAALADRGVAHTVLERGRVGESWRTQRWDSFRLNTPGWMNEMLGEQARDHFATRAEVVERLEALAATCPVREGVRVSRLAPDDEGFELRTTDGEVRVRTVVVATGDQNEPLVPALAGRIPERIAQYNFGSYRNPSQLPEGAVLVVGSAQSGCQIAEDLLAAGRRVFLATSPVGRFPWRHRGRDTVEWLTDVGFFHQRPQDLPDPSMMRAAQPIVASGGRSLSLQSLARSGATLVGRPFAVDGERIRFDESAPANVAAGDAFAQRVATLLDEVIRRSGSDAPPAEPEDTDAPAHLDPPTTLDLRVHDVNSVVWCTGVTGDFSWLPADLLDEEGAPHHDGVSAPIPGLWYVGLRWLVRRNSAVLFGFPEDAALVADAVSSRLHGGGRQSEDQR